MVLGNSRQECWKHQVCGLCIPPGARDGIFGDPQALHTHMMGSWVPLLLNSKKCRIFLHLEKPIYPGYSSLLVGFAWSKNSIGVVPTAAAPVMYRDPQELPGEKPQEGESSRAGSAARLGF